MNDIQADNYKASFRPQNNKTNKEKYSLRKSKR